MEWVDSQIPRLVTLLADLQGRNCRLTHCRSLNQNSLAKTQERVVDRFFSMIKWDLQDEETLFLTNSLLSNTSHELPSTRIIYIVLEPRFSFFLVFLHSLFSYKTRHRSICNWSQIIRDSRWINFPRPQVTCVPIEPNTTSIVNWTTKLKIW